MRLPFLGVKRNRPSRSSPAEGLEPVRSVFSKFTRIQKLNTRALQLMAEMEQALGGEYIFDRAFLESSVREMGTLAYQVVYSLNAMSRNRYVSLFDRFENIKGILDDILGGGLGPFAASLTLPYAALGWEMEPLVGAVNVCLAQARHHMDLPAPDGFAVTATGCRLFLESNRIDGPVRSGVGSQPDEALGHEVFPPELEQAILQETERLLARCRGPVRLSVRACATGGYGRQEPDLNGVNGVVPEDILSACRLALAEHRAKAAPGAGAVALAVHESVSAGVTGSVSIQAPAAGRFFVVIATSADAPDRSERYLLRRIYPYDLVQSEIFAKATDRPIHPDPLSRTPGGHYRGSALLSPAFLKTIAETAMTFERMLGCVQELHWARGEAGRPTIVGIRPFTASADDDSAACDIEDAIRGAVVLVKGGETVQTGISAGQAIHVLEDGDPESFPFGAVAVARAASPRLSPILRRASAMVTELGGSAGHLATICREMRVPGVFGVSEALERIPDGTEVTVDAGERTVYMGIVEPLLACRECSTELYPSEPEYVALRRLLRWIMPLGLIDPESRDFSAENCKTYHDIIHFAHERSVEELLHIQDRGLADLHARRLDVGVPIDLSVIDIGGGISGAAGDRLSMEDVTSQPFQAFLRGLAFKEMWSCAPAAIRLRDLFSGIDRTFSAMTASPGYAGLNHAIVAENYMNLALRLGYHFSVVDSFLSGSVNQNYVYFRFVGGFADERRRGLRAGLIRSILEEMRFKVLVKGDLVVGKLKISEKEEMTSVLTRLGELTAFTRQLDISMDSQEKAEALQTLFRQKSICTGASYGAKDPA